MAVPSAVQKIGEEAEALAVETGIKLGSSKPEEATYVVVDEPAKSKEKVDPENYKERFIRYKKQTDQTITELRGELASNAAAIIEIQRQNQELIEKLSTRTEVAIEPQASADSKDDADFKTWLKSKPENIRENYTEEYLFDQYMMFKPSQADKPETSDEVKALKEQVANLSQTQEKSAFALYEEALDVAFPDNEWIVLTDTTDPRWKAFCNKQVSGYDKRTFGQIVVNGHQGHDSEAVIGVLNTYKEHLSKLDAEQASTAASEQASLEGQLTPDNQGGGGADPITQINAQAETFRESEVKRFFIDQATGKYRDRPEEAVAIEKQIIAAQNAGKIIPG